MADDSTVDFEPQNHLFRFTARNMPVSNVRNRYVRDAQESLMFGNRLL